MSGVGELQPPMALLSLLSDGKVHSGQELADFAGVSRTAIWKQLSKLEVFGVELESRPGKGYCLKGGLDLLNLQDILSALSPEALNTNLRLAVENVIDSTNAYLLRQPPQEGLTACLAECQTAGRGRRGRVWISPFARNIYLSLRMTVESGVGALEGLSLAVGVMVARALQAMRIGDIQLKWPNDILLQGRKLGGILIEITGDPSGVCHLVVGLGLNLFSDKSMQESIDQPWAALDQVVTERIDRNRLVANLLNEIAPRLTNYGLHGFEPFHREWENLNAHVEQMVSLSSGTNLTIGKMVGVTGSGALILDTETGRQTFHGGEISLRLANDPRA